MKVKLVRFLEAEQSLIGKVYVNGEFFCYSLEKPFRGNEQYISAIPDGVYKCGPYSSEKYANIVQILDVIERDRILIHSANYHWDLKGCIALGSSYSEKFLAYNRHSKQKEFTGAVWHSRETVQRFFAKVGYEFELEIITQIES